MITANSAVPQPRMKSSSATQITKTIAEKAWFTTEALPEPSDANSINTRTIAVPMRLLALLASVAGLATLGSSYFLGDVSAVGFVISLFVLVCATEARS